MPPSGPYTVHPHPVILYLRFTSLFASSSGSHFVFFWFVSCSPSFSPPASFKLCMQRLLWPLSSACGVGAARLVSSTSHADDELVDHFAALADLNAQRRSNRAIQGLSHAELELLRATGADPATFAPQAGEKGGFSLRHCTVPATTPPMSLPPKWAMEVPRRLAASLPNLAPTRTTFYSQALIHPSFVLGAVDTDDEAALRLRTRLPDDGSQLDALAKHRSNRDARAALRMRELLRATMRPLSAMGVSVLRMAALSWASSSPHALPSKALLKAMVGTTGSGTGPSFIPSSEVLNEVMMANLVVEQWGLGDMILVHGDLLQDRRTGLIVPTAGTTGGTHLSAATPASSIPGKMPTGVLAETASALVGAVYVDKGLDDALQFALTEVIPIAVRRYLQELEEESLTNV